MKVGVVVNPKAGGGLNEEKLELVRDVISRLKPEVVYTSESELVPFVPARRVVEVEVPKTGTRKDTVELVRRLDGRVDLIVIFGGDGTMSDAASARPKTPLLCIGIGTTNVSPLLCDPDFAVEELKPVSMRGLEVRACDELRVAFNDVVVGSTILTTIGDRRIQVDAREFMRGRKVVSRPRKFRARVEVGDRVVEGVFGNIFVSIPDRRFLGRGIAGGSSLSAFLGFRGVVAMVSEGIVVSDYTKEEVRLMEPIVTQTLSFDDETVRLQAEEVVCCDGNPVCVGYAEVRVIDDAVVVMQKDK